MLVLRGISASPGYAVARLHLIVKEELRIQRRNLVADEIPAEIEHFREALAAAHAEIRSLVTRLANGLGKDEAAILESHLLILEDELLVDRTLKLIEEQKIGAEGALHNAVSDLIRQFDSLDDDYYKERVLDLRDVEERLLRRLQGLEDSSPQIPCENRVVAAEEITPSEAADIGNRQVEAFVLARGSRTSHVAILSRSLGVPAVVGIGDDIFALRDGVLVAVDGERGEVIVEPDSPTIARFQRLSRQQSDVTAKLVHLRDLPAETPDGHRVSLLANIELPIEIEMAVKAGAEGIGLLRTEYIYFQHKRIPSEEEQLRVYRDILKGMGGRPVLFRTLDVGGDKVQRYLGARQESNPFLGWRGIRFLLANQALLKSQLRAIYRAAADGPARLMFPMITGVEELQIAREICRECCRELADEGLAHQPDLEIGIMLETPSAAATADLLARECDFFSIGTNDLIQYTLAMDRLNSRVAYLYQPLHPAILRLMQKTITEAHEAGIGVGICGEMASETRYAEVLMGLGLDELSVHAAQLPKIKQVVRWTPMSEARQLVQDLLTCNTSAAAVALHQEYLAEKKRRRNEGDDA